MRHVMVEALESRQLLAGGNGLVGEYYDNSNLTTLKLTRTDSQINFNWFSGSPDPSIGPDYFSIRWTGKIQVPTSDAYTFIARADDGVRVWINAALLIDSWKVSAPSDRVGVPIALSEGVPYDIKIEYYEANGGAMLALNYQTPTQAKSPVPSSWLFDGVPVTPPAAPSGLTASPQSAATIKLDWADNSNNESGFVVQRSDDGVAFSTVYTTSANTTTCTDTGLSASTAYFYQVLAVNSAGASDPSAPAGATTPAPASGLSTVRVNVGGWAYTDSAGKKWLADTYVTGGTASGGKYEVDNTIDDPLFYQRRWGKFSYSIPVGNGDYTLTLNMADSVFLVGGNRKMDVKAEGTLLLDDFDIAGNGGGKSAIRRHFGVTVIDGKLDLQFISVKGDAILSGIEITPGLPTPGNQWVWQTQPATAPITSPIARVEAASIQIGNKLYVIGGFIDWSMNVTNRMDILNLDTMTWSSGAPHPETQTHLGIATDGTYIYTVGGQVGPGYAGNTPNSWKYDIANNVWSPFIPLPASRAGGSLVLLDSVLHYFGGVSLDRKTPTVDHWTLALDGGTEWLPAAALPVAEDHLSGVALNGKIYALGGEEGHADTSGAGTYHQYANVFIYDPAADAWTRGPDLPSPRSHAEGTTLVIDGKIVMLGGLIGTGRDTTSTIQYDPIAKVWSNLNPLPIPLHGANSAWYNNQLIFINGQTGVGAILKTAVIGTIQFTVL